MHEVGHINMELINMHWHTSTHYSEWENGSQCYPTIGVEAHYNNSVNNNNRTNNDNFNCNTNTSSPTNGYENDWNWCYSNKVNKKYIVLQPHKKVRLVLQPKKKNEH